MPDKAQISLIMGHPGIRRSDPRFYAASLMNSVLGRFAMGGRLGRVVREEQGMAYYTYSDFAAGLGAGPFAVRAGLQPQHLNTAIASIREQVAAVRDGGVTAAELDDARAAAIGSLPRTLESNEGIAGLLHQIELFELGWDFPDRYGEIMTGVTLEQANRAAGELLHPDALSISVAGPLQAAEA
jgi:zinc protease